MQETWPLRPSIEGGFDVLHGVLDAAIEVDPRTTQAHIAEHILEQQLQTTAKPVLGHLRVGARTFERIEILTREFEFRCDADSAERAPRHRTEERSRKGGIGETGRARVETIADALPKVPVVISTRSMTLQYS